MTNNKLTDETLDAWKTEAKISLGETAKDTPEYSHHAAIFELVTELQEYRNAAPIVPEDYLHLKNVQELYHNVERKLFALTKRVKPDFDTHNDSCSDAIRELERHIFGGTVEDGAAVRAALSATYPPQAAAPHRRNEMGFAEPCHCQQCREARKPEVSGE